MQGKRGFALVAGVVTTAALAGCGGDAAAPVVSVGSSGASGAAGTAGLTKSDLIDQGDAICGEANAALQSLTAGTTGPDQKTEVNETLQITQSELRSLQSLTPPSQDRSTLERFLSGLEDEVRALARQKAAIEQGGDTSTAQAVVASSKSSALNAAQAYGFKDCAKGAGAATSTATPPTVTTPTVPVPTTPTTPVTPTTPTTPAPAAPPAAPAPPAAGGGTGGATGGATGGGTGGGSSTGGGGGGGGTGGSGGVSP